MDGNTDLMQWEHPLERPVVSNSGFHDPSLIFNRGVFYGLAIFWNDSHCDVLAATNDRDHILTFFFPWTVLLPNIKKLAIPWGDWNLWVESLLWVDISTFLDPWAWSFHQKCCQDRNIQTKTPKQRLWWRDEYPERERRSEWMNEQQQGV